jgi:hypothetical protein
MGCLPNKTLILRNIKKQKENKYEKEDFRENYEMYVENEEKHEEDTEAFDYSKIQGVVKLGKKIIIDLNNANKNGKTLNKNKKNKKKIPKKTPIKKGSSHLLIKKIKKLIEDKKGKKEKILKDENLEIAKLIKSDNVNININNSSNFNININNLSDFFLINELNFSRISEYDDDKINDFSPILKAMTNHDRDIDLNFSRISEYDDDDKINDFSPISEVMSNHDRDSDRIFHFLNNSNLSVSTHILQTTDLSDNALILQNPITLLYRNSTNSFNTTNYETIK